MSYVDAALEYSLAIAPADEERYASVKPLHLPYPQYYANHTQRKQPRVHALYETKSAPTSSPRVLRLCSPVVCAALPVSCIWQPFAEEAPLLTIEDFGKWRCKYCKAYLNAGFSWEGDSFLCNLCGNKQERDVHMPQVDIGTYEVVAPSDYGEAARARTVCLLDCRDASQLGSIKSLLRSVLDRIDTEVCVMSFSRLISFYCGTKLEVLKVEGETEPWTPVPIDLLFTGNAKLAIEVLEAEGGQLPLSDALRFAGKALEGHGHLVLLSPGRECIDHLPEVLRNIQVDLVFCGQVLPALFSEWTRLCLSTGGRAYTSPSLISAPYTAALARVRCSDGLQLHSISGSGRFLDDGTWAVAGLSSNSCLALEFQLQAKATDISLQLALVYTYQDQRCVRVFNGKWSVTDSIDEVVELSDPECVAYCLLQPLWFSPDSAHLIYPAFFDYIGRVCADKDIDRYVRTEFPVTLSLLSLYCHCALRRLDTNPVELMEQASALALRELCFYLYPGIYSCRQLEKGSICSSQVKGSWSCLKAGEIYVVQQGKDTFLCGMDGSASRSELSLALQSALQQIAPDELTFGCVQLEERKLKVVLVEDAVGARPSYAQFMSDHLTTLSRTVFS